MAEAALDTLATACGLREGGFDEGQAEAIAVAIREGVTGGVAVLNGPPFLAPRGLS